MTPEGIEAHPHRTGHLRTDRIIAAAAIFMSLLSLMVAYKHGVIMKELVAANSWPLLQAGSGNTSDEGRSVIAIGVRNVGVGPAIIRRFSVEYGGNRYTSGDAFLSACCGRTAAAPNGKFRPGEPITNFIDKTVIGANEERPLLSLERVPGNEAIWQRLDAARFKARFEACYCSVLGQCWESDLTGIDPQPVNQCREPEPNAS